jgi:serine/threonine protein kinase
VEEIEILKACNHVNVVRFVDAYEEEVAVAEEGTKTSPSVAVPQSWKASTKQAGAAQRTERHLYMILEYVNGGEVFEKITRKNKFPERHARSLFDQILKGVAHLHERGICHRDLKPENIILRPEGDGERAVIVDFGIAVCKPPGMTSASTSAHATSARAR